MHDTQCNCKCQAQRQVLGEEQKRIGLSSKYIRNQQSISDLDTLSGIIQMIAKINGIS